MLSHSSSSAAASPSPLPLRRTRRTNHGDSGRHHAPPRERERPSAVLEVVFSTRSCRLESSGHRFLWVVRNPRQDPSNLLEQPQDLDLAALLPEGFLERTGDRRMVVKSWAPQAEVLWHTATARSSRTVAGTRLYDAEQRLNKLLIVEEMKRRERGAGVVKILRAGRRGSRRRAG
ncbi:hypothetical protein ABZP36_007304 [Zizania latifolia]